MQDIHFIVAYLQLTCPEGYISYLQNSKWCIKGLLPTFVEDYIAYEISRAFDL